MGISRPILIVVVTVVIVALSVAGYSILIGGSKDMPDELNIGGHTFTRTDRTYTAEELGSLWEVGEYNGLKVYEDPDFSANSKFIRRSDGKYVQYNIEGPILCEKPNIYLYPEAETALTVWLDIQGHITISIPEYQNGWKVTVTPDGQITDDDGQQYRYLFYSAAVDYEFTLREGWVVRRNGFAGQMARILEGIGLNQQEKDDFIDYWDARLEWKTEAYAVYWLSPEEVNQVIGLNLSEKPDALLRAFFCFAPADTDTELPEPSLPAFERQGFTVVEWGGIVKE